MSESLDDEIRRKRDERQVRMMDAQGILHRACPTCRYEAMVLPGQPQSWVCTHCYSCGSVLTKNGEIVGLELARPALDPTPPPSPPS